MQLGFFISGVGGQMAQYKLDNISHNLANANTVGYMEDRAAFSSFMSSELGREGAPEQTSSAFLSMNKQYVSTESGTIRHTGNGLDFAIRGNGYFRVRADDGQEVLTRAGNFKLDADGNLLTQGGQPVLDQGGSPIVLPRGEISATDNGTIYVNGEPAADLGIATIKDTRRIQKLAGVLLRTPADNIGEPDKGVAVVQGSLQDSNVNSILAMAQMVDTMRGYQSMMKVVEQYNQQAGLLNDKVGVVQG
jgi:flagellar basal body rod protein FlgG